jgi:hypothetical protein
MLLVSVLASGDAIQASRCPDQPQKAAATHETARADRAGVARPVPVSFTTGLDLEVRILNVRIGFPWLKSLPVTPGRRIVVSLWEQESDR